LTEIFTIFKTLSPLTCSNLELKSCPCAPPDHHAMKAYWGSGCTAPPILWPRH
jgi:hypothetical protein